MRTDNRASLLLAGIAGALLLSGLFYYVAFRTVRPTPFEHLQLKPLALTAGLRGSAVLGSVPSLIHVTAFGLLTCALLRPRVVSALLAGAAWAGIGVLWELSCADGQAWLRRGGELIGVGSVPVCTYDGGDIVASVAGVAAAAGIAWIVVKSGPSSPRNLRSAAK